MRRGHGDARSRQAQRGLDETPPRERPGASPKLVDPRRDAGNGAGGGAHEVVHQLLAEGNRELLEIRRLGRPAEPGHGHEEVEHLRPISSRFEPEGIAAARDARHHGLRDARGEHGRHRGVRRRPALGEDLEARLGRRRMACSNAWGYLHLC